MHTTVINNTSDVIRFNAIVATNILPHGRYVDCRAKMFHNNIIIDADGSWMCDCALVYNIL